MTAIKEIGIWMDHAGANLMEFTADPIQTKTMDSKFTHDSFIFYVGNDLDQIIYSIISNGQALVKLHINSVFKQE